MQTQLFLLFFTRRTEKAKHYWFLNIEDIHIGLRTATPHRLIVFEKFVWLSEEEPWQIETQKWLDAVTETIYAWTAVDTITENSTLNGLEEKPGGDDKLKDYIMGVALQRRLNVLKAKVSQDNLQPW
eukprot:GHVU01018684.1.p2 GENE.GHVU01018684.1~~GHVU01018684.1.p2  ORF type:complete len:127 (+),score=16.24 GHVU01018684.1:470-850(+)